MLISLKGRESLLGLWKKQKRVCPICNDPIDKGKEWYLASIYFNGKTVKSLVHINCCRRINNLSLKWRFWAGFLMETLGCLSRMRGNSHVRFLEGEAAVMPLTYSTQWVTNGYLPNLSFEFNGYLQSGLILLNKGNSRLFQYFQKGRKTPKMFSSLLFCNQLILWALRPNFGQKFGRSAKEAPQLPVSDAE